MVLDLVSLAVTAPLLATSTLQLQKEAENTSSSNTTSGSSNDQAMKTQKCTYTARASPRMSERRKQQLQNCSVVLRDGALYLQRQNAPSTTSSHPLTGYLLRYPDASHDGLVTTINAENMLNWVYIHSETYQVRYGVRAEAENHWTCPMSVLVTKAEDGEKRLMFDGWEGFVVVKVRRGEWALYFDKDDDGLKGKVGDHAVVEVELVRGEEVEN